jgi:hypothetical protein
VFVERVRVEGGLPGTRGSGSTFNSAIFEALRAEQGEPGALGSLLKRVGRKSRVALNPR